MNQCTKVKTSRSCVSGDDRLSPAGRGLGQAPLDLAERVLMLLVQWASGLKLLKGVENRL